MKAVRYGAALLLLLAVVQFNGHSAEPKTLAEIMRKKLEHSQLVLEGVVVNDFDKIAENAEELIVLSKHAEWQAIKTPSYELYSNEFRRTAETLVQQAKAKNIDGAALAYVDLTLNCVKCHKYVRQARTARQE